MTLDDGTLRSLASKSGVVAEFPELRPLLSLPKSNCCGGQSKSQKILLSVRAAMAGLSDERKTRLKELLGTSSVQVNYRSGKEVKQVKF